MPIQYNQKRTPVAGTSLAVTGRPAIKMEEDLNTFVTTSTPRHNPAVL